MYPALFLISLCGRLANGQAGTIHEVLGERITELPSDTECRQEIKDMVKGVYDNVEKLTQKLVHFSTEVEEKREQKKFQGLCHKIFICSRKQLHVFMGGLVC